MRATHLMSLRNAALRRCGNLPEGTPLVLKNSATSCRVFIFILMETIFLLHLGVERLFWTALR